MTAGAELFARYAFPPNVLGYCGPDGQSWAETLEGAGSLVEVARVVQQFEGAWPYLEIIGGLAGMDPLDARVVEAYWIGNDLIDGVDVLTWGNSIDDRFRGRAGNAWTALSDTIPESRPNHAFHVFCVYPWVGLLRSGHADHALEVIDRCRIRWGRVVGGEGAEVVVEARHLTWDGQDLRLGEPSIETVERSVAGPAVRQGDLVSLHWHHLCDVIDDRRAARLRTETAHHLALVSRSQRELAATLER
jgi:hypothetical protein